MAACAVCGHANGSHDKNGCTKCTCTKTPNEE